MEEELKKVSIKGAKELASGKCQELYTQCMKIQITCQHTLARFLRSFVSFTWLFSESVDSDKGPGKKVETKKSTSPNKKLVDDVMYLAGLTSNNGQKESVSKQTRAFLDTEDATELLLGKGKK